MSRLSCAICGRNADAADFTFAGGAGRRRPASYRRTAISDKEQCAYLYGRATEARQTATRHELWRCDYGCRSWFEVARDAASGAVKSVQPAASPSGRDGS